MIVIDCLSTLSYLSLFLYFCSCRSIVVIPGMHATAVAAVLVAVLLLCFLLLRLLLSVFH